VVRTLRDHDYIAEPRLLAILVGILLSNHDRRLDAVRKLRCVLHFVFTLLSLLAHRGDFRSEGDISNTKPRPTWSW